MADPTSVSSLSMVAAGLGLAAVLPGIDGNALIGAFAGGTLFVVSAPSMPLWQRVLYLGVSVAAGYQATSDLMALVPLKSTGVAAFIASATCVSLTLAVIDRCKRLDFSWLRRGGPPNG